MYQRAQEQAANATADGDGAASSNGAGSEEEDVVRRVKAVLVYLSQQAEP